MRIGRLALVVLLGLGGMASADTPWSVGVTEQQKAQAQVELDAGNALFLDKKYSEALARYQAAIGAWDHPAIRFNVVRCLIQLDRPVEAFDNLKLTLKYGAAPLEEGVYTEALSYEKLLANQIGELAISCKQPDVKLTLDGKALATCPASEKRRVAPGSHQLVGVREGYLTRTIEVVVVGGQAEQVEVSLAELTTAARIEHRWPSWIPWVVFAGGFAITGIGGVLDLNAATELSAYDRTVREKCAEQACQPGVLDENLRENAELKSRIAVGVMIVGAATIATGGLMLYMNRGRTVYPGARERIVPSVSPVRGGVTLGLSRAF